MNGFPHLSVLLLLPLACGALLALQTSLTGGLARRLALGVSGLVLLGAGALVTGFNPGVGGMQFVERHTWIPSLGVDYFLGVDGLGLAMVLLTAVVTPMSILASPPSLERAPLFFGLILILEAGVLGTFLALNFFHWFLFWELSLIPAFFLVRFWGGPQRIFAATQFFIYTMVGSVTLLLGFLGLFLATRSFDFLDLASRASTGELLTAVARTWDAPEGSGRTMMTLLFFGIFLGFAVKVPIVPLHGWLPLAYGEAPTGVVMLLTGLMSKMGVYGFLRIVLPIFPEQVREFTTPLLWLIVVGMLFAAGAAFAQTDLKRLLAFSSVGHLGFCLLGAFSLGATTAIGDPAAARLAALGGVILQMFNHGLTAATLFWLAGLLEARTGTRRILELGGIRAVAPIFCGLMGIAVFASLGLPGLNGFISEFLILKGAFALAPDPTTVSLLGLLITAVYLLTLLQRIFHGPLAGRWERFPDLTPRERTLLAAPLALMLLLGVWPQALLGPLWGTLETMAGSLLK